MKLYLHIQALFAGMILTIASFAIFHDCNTSTVSRDDSTDTMSTGMEDQAKDGFTFDDLLDAIEDTESGGDANAKGDYSEETGEYRAIGAYQLWKIYVDDCNRIMKLNEWTGVFTYEDRSSKRTSRLITNIVTQHYAMNDWKGRRWDMMGYLETAARTHKCPTERNNQSTKAYWNKVKARMESVK